MHRILIEGTRKLESSDPLIDGLTSRHKLLPALLRFTSVVIIDEEWSITHFRWYQIYNPSNAGKDGKGRDRIAVKGIVKGAK